MMIRRWPRHFIDFPVHVAAGEIVGTGLRIAGRVLSVVGGGLLLGGVTVLAGIPILVVGAALGVGRRITDSEVGATIDNDVIGHCTSGRGALCALHTYHFGNELQICKYFTTL